MARASAASGGSASARLLPPLLLAVVVLATAASAVDPYDGPTWWMESFPVLAGVPLLVATYRRFPLTSLAYVLIAIHAVILVVGGHWTYARVPLGNWAQEAFDLARNPYDRLGHFIQGFAPAIVCREVLLRTSPLKPGAWTFTLVASFCLALSAAYELIEWATAVVAGSGDIAFLGTQGDVWDAQWDMLTALIGALLAQILLSRWHDRQMARLSPIRNP